MIIIIEGPDGSGKSMLAKQLSRQTGYSIIHSTQPKTEEDKKRMMDEYLQSIRAGKNMIFDRSWYSEMAYGPVMRDASVISYPEMYTLEAQLAKTGALIIYCTGPTPALWKRCTARGEEYVTNHGDFIDICNNFDTLMAVPHCVPIVRYEYKEV